MMTISTILTEAKKKQGKKPDTESGHLCLA
jgi:hypothetical protein